MTKRTRLKRLITLGCITALLALPQIQAHAQDKISAAEARAIAKEAYIYGYPMVDSYRIQYGYFVDKNDPEYKGPWNEIHNIAARLHPGGQGRPDAQFRHAVFLSRCRPPGRTARADRP